MQSAEETEDEKTPTTGDQPAAEESAADQPSSGEEKPAENAPAEELPQQIELTPEIIEDEALRNDFMLRFAVVLLAVLFACTQIGETATLVHVKAGAYMAGHGVLPPRTDVFTHTAAKQPWVNLSWLFDLFAAGVYAAGGAIALTIVKALIAGATFFLLLKAVKRPVPSWWASICAALALIVCAGQLTFEPQLITLLGLALTLWIIFRWQPADSPASLWPLVPVFLVWCNMDPRAFFGLIVLILLALGEGLGLFAGRCFQSDEAKRRQLWLMVPVSIGVFFINPFFWHSLISPASLYGREYPAWRELMELAGGSLHSYLPLTAAAFWQNLTLPVITALVLAATVPVTFALNWRNIAPAQGLLFLGMAGLGLANSHDLTAASLVFAALAALNAQEWYAESFRQGYSVELSERVFSVGGRAVTALAFFGLAFLAVSGRLLGPGSNRLGFGFRPSLANLIEGIREDLNETEVPGNGFNFSIRQGDVLIWLDRKPFIDTRLNVFTQDGADSVFARYRRFAEALSPLAVQRDETQKAFQARRLARAELLEKSKKQFEEYEITHAVVSLGPDVPQYGVLFNLFRYSDWRPIRLGPMAAWFYRYNPEKSGLNDRTYLAEHGLDFFELAFRTEEKTGEKADAESPGYFPRPPGWTDELFASPSRQTNPPDALLAWHYTVLINDYLLPERSTLTFRNPGDVQALEIINQTGLAMGNLAIRHAHKALEKNPNSTLAYRALAECCLRLVLWNRRPASYTASRWEIPSGGCCKRLPLTTRRSSPTPTMPACTAVWARSTRIPIGTTWPSASSSDSWNSRKCRTKTISKPRKPTNADCESSRTSKTRSNRFRRRSTRRPRTKPLRSNSPTWPKRAAACSWRSKLLETADESQLSNPLVSMIQAGLELEAGEIEEAYQSLGRLEGVMKEQGAAGSSAQGKDLIAMSALVVGEYERAIDLWSTEADEMMEAMMFATLGTLPMAERPIDPPLFRRVGDDWASANWQMGYVLTQQLPQMADGPLFNAALSDLERGRPKKAAERLKRLLDINPESIYRPLAALYIGHATGESVDLLPPSAFIPTWPGMFAPDPAEKPQKPEPPKPNETQQPNTTEKQPRGK